MSALVADHERLVMLQHGLAHGLAARVAFEVQVRRLPPATGWLVAAGLEQVVRHLKSFSFSEAEQAWLAEAPGVTPDFVARAKALRFDGDLDAVPEGSVCFADEPLLRITAPLPLAQYLETQVLGLLRHEISVGSWASRLGAAAGGRRLVEASHRVAPSGDAAVLAARACYLAGFDGTSSPDACRRFRIPLCRAVTAARPDPAEIDPEALGAVVYGAALPAAAIDHVRLVGADLPGQAAALRRRLDAQGLQRLRILACADFDADRLAALVASGAPIDAFGPLPVAVPTVDIAYLLQPPGPAAAGRQVWREFAADGTLRRDTVAAAGEPGPAGALPLLQPVLRDGHRVGRPVSLEDSRAHHAAQRAALPAAPAAVEVVRGGRLAQSPPPGPTAADLRADPRSA